MKRQIIIAADDFGFSEAFNIGAVKACRKGVATVLNLLCNMPATENAIEIWKKECPHIQLTAHINFVQGRPVSAPEDIRSLVDENGNFYRSRCWKSDLNDSDKCKGNIYPDIVLVDNDGNIDLIEIKRPQYDIFYKNVYRNNYVPIRELQGTCMQLQNYLISLTKTSNDSLQQEKFKVDSNIPKDFQLKATSPKGYIIYGRDMQLEGNEKMLTDFQIVRNMYSNVIDIITYDDLIRRLENMLKALEVSL